jgi:serine phosphatase RsbU (regulator of sigma subunit)
MAFGLDENRYLRCCQAQHVQLCSVVTPVARACLAVLLTFFFLSYSALFAPSGPGHAASLSQDGSQASERPGTPEREAFIKKETITRAGRAGLFLAVGLVHLLLFAFYPRERANLLFSLFAIGLSLVVFLTLLLAVNSYPPRTLLVLQIVFAAAIGFASSVELAFLYAAFGVRAPKFFWIAAAGWVAYVLAEAGLLRGAFAWFAALNFFTAGESVRVTVQALRRRVDGAWIIGCGVFFTALVAPKEVLLTAGVPIPAVVSALIDQAYTLAIVVSISIYLARKFARTNRQLEAQLVQVRELSARTIEHERKAAELQLQHEREQARLALIEAENERRAREMEEARSLQISLLPKRMPQAAGLEIAAYMQPAAEVGGDYYDFRLSSDGTLTVAVGDATGHGLKAGMMVTATKSLFETLAEQDEISQILHQSSIALKRMNLRSLFMAMSLVRIRGLRMTVGAAGMPPVLIYREQRREVEEVALYGLPLGSVTSYSYRQTELTLAEGDVVVMMSDGFPERFSHRNEMLGYDRVKAVLADTAGLGPQEIINRFVAVGDAWAEGHPQDDDVTFVVIRCGRPDDQQKCDW